jgi:membrane protein DedA with SNARE-associated domain
MDVFTPDWLISFLQTNGYILLFLIMVFEGSIVTYIAAFLASTGIFNIYIVFGLSLLGNLVGDTIFYYSGRYLGENYIKKHFHKIKENHLGKLIILAKDNPGAALLIIKNTPMIPIPGLMLIGASGLKAKSFYIHSTYLSFIRSLLFVVLGYFSGHAFLAIASVKNVELIIAAAVLFSVVVYVIIKRLLKRYVKKVEERRRI